MRPTLAVALLAGAALTGPALLAPVAAGAAPAPGTAPALTPGVPEVPRAPEAPGWQEARPPQEDGEVRELRYRVSDLTFRVRELSFNWRALDESERVEQTPEETTISLAADVLFEFDRADLTPAAQEQLAGVADELADVGPRTVAIDGHTDNHGEPAYNQDLSERRAEAVRAWLADRLGGEFTFETAGHGEDRPVAANENEDGSDNPEGRAVNRRVEIRYPRD
jgi:outer membrane protein OmpA-like peptidoglycan-associated protein